RWSLEGKNVVVTGGTKGIGAACVEELCAMGACVLTCSRNATELAQCAEAWRGQGYQVHTVAADLSTTEGRQALLQATEQTFGSVHCLVNNVGRNIRKRAIEYAEEEYSLITETNLKSAYALTIAMHPLLCRGAAEGGASVVNVGSVAGGCGTAMRSGVVYAMGKAALTQV
ncbi:hypothetical protein B484DRAFT_309476, partial [Ochromonadaceae sp. CCMP2298]